MKMIRNKTRLIKMTKTDNPFVSASADKCVSFIWELTAELWSLKGSPYVKRKLQRNITKLIKIKTTGNGKDKLDAKYLKKNKPV